MKTCKFCKAQNLIKNGTTRGEQRYLCKECGKNQVSGDKREKYDNKTRYLALAMYLNNAGFWSIGRVLGVPFQLVHTWIRKAGNLTEQEIAKKRIPARDIEVLEMDELYTYIQKKTGKSGYGLLWMGTEMKLLRIR